MIEAESCRYVSKNHLIFKEEGEGVILKDTSKNGTWISKNRNKRIKIHQQSVQLSDGDEIWIGSKRTPLNYVFYDGTAEMSNPDKTLVELMLFGYDQNKEIILKGRKSLHYSTESEAETED
eukprot:TRINITY_DN4811_c0_g1_i2.p1 TRINITY_DN4811_c0_g1~~TRINITY_DN4811_c0_g1_i2.p1  ORF type:complete len:121 (+),score=32.88 TRINITY_DN4811_c0_g1_i2:309-671(+)